MSVEDRSWMYQGWSDTGRQSEAWVRKTDAFLDLAFSSVPNAERSGVLCSCTDCRNGVRQRRTVLSVHLFKRGFMPGYTRWTEHGESPISTVPTAGHSHNTPDADLGDAKQAGSVEEKPIAEAKTFSAMLRAAQEPLHDGTRLPRLTFVAHLMAVKSRHNLSAESIDALLSLVDDALQPKNHKMPKTVNECNSLLSGLNIPHGACVNNCTLCNQEGQSKDEYVDSDDEIWSH